MMMTKKQSILIVEDEAKIAAWVQTYCARAGYDTTIAYDGETGLQQARALSPDLIILDLMLPKMSGLEVCRTLRRESDVPIIMLTAKGDHPDRIDGLASGADDYVVKPFDPNEVVARVEAVLRRVKGRAQRILTLGHITLDEDAQMVLVENRPITLTPAQFSLLSIFMRHPNQVLSRTKLIEMGFDSDFDAYDRAIDSHIKRLRKQIMVDGAQPIETVYGLGYKFVAEQQPVEE